MVVLDAPLAALQWLGRQGTRALSAMVLVGLACPWMGAYLKPYLTEVVFVLLVTAFLRVDIAGVRAHLRRPGLVLAATAWTSLAMPLLFALLSMAAGVHAREPDLFLALMLQAAASPLMAAPALAALMGLDGTLVLVTLITSTVLVPVTAPLFAKAFVGPALSIPAATLAAKLFLLLAGAALAGVVLRRVLGLAAFARHRATIDGINILALFVFVAALMEIVTTRLLADTRATLVLAALAFLAFFAVLLLTVLVFLPAGRERALALGLMVSQRNMGLMLAATGGALPELTWLYFALSQFPIYLAPQLLQPLARRVLAAGARRRGAGAAIAPVEETR
jgi:BASS family bile acid:Na+ symporter